MLRNSDVRLISLAARFARTSLAIVIPGVSWSWMCSLQVPQCADSVTVSAAGECSCPPACGYSYSVTPTIGSGYCSGCHWNYSWSTTCPPCSMGSSGSGSVNLQCDPHRRSSQKVILPCPVSGADWVTMLFACPNCQ